MPTTLTSSELAALVARVFKPRPEDGALALLVDLPDAALADHPRWAARRAMAAGWARQLAAASVETGLATQLVLYRNVRMNNADLPPKAWPWDAARPLPATADALDEAEARPFEAILRVHSILIAPTELSATAPLKLMARTLGFRAATMPGFSEEMIPALRLDYGEINRRVQVLKALLDRAERADIEFLVAGRGGLSLRLDLRHRSGHASGGLLPDPGTAGNLPSGEAYVVPYEGERASDPSRSAGLLPVQLGGEVVVYRIEQNHAIAVEAGGDVARGEAARLRAEPAYGNLAELGLGVLADFGIAPSGEILLDEKLGLHLAFGRSDHFGGTVGAAQFTRPEAVVHIDRVYIRELQPQVSVARVDLAMDDGRLLPLMRDGRYVVPF